MRFTKVIIAILLLTACGSQIDSNQLIIFHAGSLSVPMKEVVKAFKQENPDIKILTESAGSRACARKITDLKRDCDIMASADYSVIDQMLISSYTDWNVKFASNKMCIVFTDKSRYADRIDSCNWFDILMKDDVAFGRSDPNSDPCGYRTVLVARLADIYYNNPTISKKLLAKDQKYIRPKETDLLALLETNTLDYVFIYRSVAVQHHLKFIELPAKINLENPGFAEYYKQVSVEISGKKLGEKIVKTGEPMIYGVTVLNNAPNKENALKFTDFLLSTKGMNIMEKNGQPSIVPMYTNSFDQIPERLKKYALK